MSIITANNFTFAYPGMEENALEGVSFDIKQGEVLGVIGPIGAGKTTLCMAIAGLAPRITGGNASGEMQMHEQDSQHSSEDRHQQPNQSDAEESHPIGMVFEDYAGQLTQLKVIDEVTTPLLNRGLSNEEADQHARELLNQVGLNPDELKNRRVWELSGGQQQRLAIAATLATDPQILIFDKAIDRLDPRGQEKVRSIIENLAGQKTLVVVEQDTQLLKEISDRILVIVDGKVIAEGKPEDILRDDNLTSNADVTPPVSLRVARALGLADAPLTVDEFERAFNHNGTKQNSSPSESHLRPVVEIRDYRSSNQRHDGSHELFTHSREQNDGVLSGKVPSANKTQFGEAIVQVEHLSFCYPDGTQALNDVSLEIHAGEVHAVVGNSNAGKTTLVMSLTNLLKPNKGKIRIGDADTQNISATDLAVQIGTVFQNPDEQISERTVRDEIGFPLKERQYRRTGLFSKQQCYDDNYIQTRISHAAELVGIREEQFDQDPILLPGGLRRLVTLAEAMAVDPQVLSLDEPTVGLSATSRHKLKEAIEQLRQMGKAILLTENDVDFVAEIADTVTVLDQGRVVLQGPTHKVLAAQNWAQLSELYIKPPRVAQLANRIGVDALRFDELIAKLSSQQKEA